MKHNGEKGPSVTPKVGTVFPIPTSAGEVLHAVRRTSANGEAVVSPLTQVELKTYFAAVNERAALMRAEAQANRTWWQRVRSKIGVRS